MKFVISHALLKEGMELLEKLGAEVYVAGSNYPEEYLDKIQEADALILREGEFQRELVEQCRNLKVIGITGVGYDNVDVKTAASLGIPVVVTPGANQYSVAEQVVAFMMMFSKNIVAQDQAIREGNWAYRNVGKGFELRGKTLGIVGCGRIGRCVADICRILGMKTLGYDVAGRGMVEAGGFEYCETLDELLRRSDFVSIHCLLTADTFGLISRWELAQMKPTAYLINCARGPIVDEEALAEALNQGRLAGAAADVYSVEPIAEDNPLLTARNTWLTPHTSGIAKEALARMSTMAVEGCAAVIRGERWNGVVDRSAFNHPHFTEREKKL